MLALLDDDGLSDGDALPLPLVEGDALPLALPDGEADALADCDWLVVTVTVVHADADELRVADTDDDGLGDGDALPHALSDVDADKEALGQLDAVGDEPALEVAHSDGLAEGEPLVLSDTLVDTVTDAQPLPLLVTLPDDDGLSDGDALPLPLVDGDADAVSLAHEDDEALDEIL